MKIEDCYIDSTTSTCTIPLPPGTSLKEAIRMARNIAWSTNYNGRFEFNNYTVVIKRGVTLHSEEYMYSFVNKMAAPGVTVVIERLA